MQLKLLLKIKNMLFKSFLRKIIGVNINYKNYWNKRYLVGGNSGLGSYGELGLFKVNFVNNFLKEKNIESVIEFGCGDGSQLRQINYKKYLGLDVAASSVEMCSKLFKEHNNKSFLLYDPMHFVNNNFLKADLVVCIDVLYHIIPEDHFLKTLDDIFSCSNKYVILYTSIDAYKLEPYKKGTHVRHRDMVSYLKNINDYNIMDIVHNPLPNLSSASFIILKKNN